MSVPEASMNENDFSTAWKNKIRIAGQIAPMQAITIAEAV